MCVCGGRGTRLGGVGKAVDTRPSFGNPSSHYTSGGPFFKKKNIKVLCSKSFFFLRVAIQFRYQRERESFQGKTKVLVHTTGKSINSKCLKESKVIVCFIVFISRPCGCLSVCS
jgi:hypothetical protein